MIIGIGVDMIEINRVAKAAEKSTFLNKYFTEEEQQLFQRKGHAENVAGNFAVKEAVSKAFGTGFSGGVLAKDIAVLRDEKERPFIKLSGTIEALRVEMGIDKIHVSISHSKEIAIAYVIAEGGKKNENSSSGTNARN